MPGETDLYFTVEDTVARWPRCCGPNFAPFPPSGAIAQAAQDQSRGFRLLQKSVRELLAQPAPRG